MAAVRPLLETLFQKNVKAWLEHRRLLWWRMAVSGITHRGGRVRAKNNLKGIPDLMGVLTRREPGRLWAIELKTSRGRLGPDQELWLSRLRDAGCAVAVVSEMVELDSFFRNLGEIQ
jgi:hypothetical protein